MGYCFDNICYNDDMLGYPILDVKMTYPELFGILFVVGVIFVVGLFGLLYIIFGKDK